MADIPGYVPPPVKGVSGGGTKILILVGVFWSLATLFVGLRFWARFLRKTNFLVEDWLVLCALIVYYGSGITIILSVTNGGVGWHVIELPPSQLSFGLKVLLAGEIFYAVGLGCIKSSIVLMLIRIFATKTFRWCGIAVLMTCIAWAVMTILIGFLLCQPLGYNWNLLPTAGHCGDQMAAYAAVGYSDIATDLLILFLPLPMIWKLRLPLASKVAVAGLLWLGVFTIAMSIARTVTITHTDFSDFTYNIYNYVWPVVEFGTAIVVACGSLLRPLFTRFEIFGSRVDTTKHRTRMGSKSGFASLTESGLDMKSISGNNAKNEVTVEAGHTHSHSHGMRNNSAAETLVEDGDVDVLPKDAIAVRTQWDCV